MDEACGKFSTSSNILLLVLNDSSMKYETPGERDRVYSLMTGVLLVIAMACVAIIMAEP